MSNRQRLLRPSLLVLILACLLPNGVPGAETPDGAGVVIGLKTAASGYGVGDTVSVKLEIRGAENLNAVKVHLKYDSTLLQFVPPAVEGSFMSSDGTNAIFLAGDGPEGGELKVGLARLSAGEGISGKGTLAEFSFEAVAPGKVELELTNGGVKGPSKQDLPATFRGARFLVVGG